MRLLFLSFVFTLSLLFYSFNPTGNRSVDLLHQMIDSIEKINQVSYRIKAWERIQNLNEKVFTEVKAKLQKKPKRKIYVKKLTDPNKGAEILWVEGKWDGEAYVCPNSFPYINMTLSPYNSMMRKKQHHTILSTGFGLFSKIVKDAVKSAKERNALDQVFRYKGVVNHNHRPCHKIIVKNRNFGFKSYKVKQGEDLDHIANKYNICAYLIIVNNQDVDDFDDVSEGQTIKIPTNYAKKSVLFIDKENKLPIGLHLFDEKGQFERYEIFDLDTNPSFADKEFTKEYDEYGF